MFKPTKNERDLERNPASARDWKCNEQISAHLLFKNLTTQHAIVHLASFHAFSASFTLAVESPWPCLNARNMLCCSRNTLSSIQLFTIVLWKDLLGERGAIWSTAEQYLPLVTHKSASRPTDGRKVGKETQWQNRQRLGEFRKSSPAACASCAASWWKTYGIATYLCLCPHKALNGQHWMFTSVTSVLGWPDWFAYRSSKPIAGSNRDRKTCSPIEQPIWHSRDLWWLWLWVIEKWFANTHSPTISTVISWTEV